MLETVALRIPNVSSISISALPWLAKSKTRAHVNVAFVPDPDGPGGGELATLDTAFSGFSFTDVSYASVNAATLANYDTVVLITCDPMNNLNASQRTDIVNWVNNGGKLIIYDSECKSDDTVDYTWLPCKAIIYCPWALGADKYGIRTSFAEDPC